MIRHFYHVYAAGAWSEPAREHVEALNAAEFPGHVTVTLVGSPADRHAARAIIGSRVRVPELDWIEADDGFEQVTLSVLRSWACSVPASTPVLYAHTKGAYDQSTWNTIWRRSMTRRAVAGWRDCVGIFAEDWDTVGCHWLIPERDHNPPDYLVPTPFYGGNFWWARAGYIARLPEPGTGYRHQAEEWIGLGNPRACDLLPGWPSMALCGGENAAV